MMEKLFDIEKIMELIPHRYPFILIDRVMQFERGKRIVALKNVTINEPFFLGHFPGKPIMPGVLIVEAMAQAGGILWISSQDKEAPGSLFFFTGIDKARFRRPVVPGDQIIVVVEMLKVRGKVAKMKGKALVEDKIVAEGELMASIGGKL
jgi:3-hydroxyacyl-[acyl-carrier-protein] dehydratase